MHLSEPVKDFPIVADRRFKPDSDAARARVNQPYYFLVAGSNIIAASEVRWHSAGPDAVSDAYMCIQLMLVKLRCSERERSQPMASPCRRPIRLHLTGGAAFVALLLLSAACDPVAAYTPPGKKEKAVKSDIQYIRWVANSYHCRFPARQQVEHEQRA
jgi:hypothetical protein